MDSNDQQARRVSAKQAARAPYQTPVLTELGDLRGMTLGGSPGTGESGSGGTRFN